MFEDRRSQRVVWVAHCILNQNAKIDGCAHYPGAMREAAQALIDAGVGLAQLPCPELLHLGLDRGADPDAPRTIESEDTRVALAMNAPEGRAACARWAEEAARQTAEYRRCGFEVVGVLGINGSPTCGVEWNWSVNGCEEPEPGVFMAALQAELNLPARGLRAARPAEAVETVHALLKTN